MLTGVVCSLVMLPTGVCRADWRWPDHSRFERGQSSKRGFAGSRKTHCRPNRGPYGSPVTSVNVQFSVPDSGPGGAFVTDIAPLVVVTDRDGVAVAPPFRSNSTPGPYEIGIQASYRGEVSKVTVSQSNLAKKASTKKILLISAALGAPRRRRLRPKVKATRHPRHLARPLLQRSLSSAGPLGLRSKSNHR